MLLYALGCQNASADNDIFGAGFRDDKAISMFLKVVRASGTSSLLVRAPPARPTSSLFLETQYYEEKR